MSRGLSTCVRKKAWKRRKVWGELGLNCDMETTHTLLVWGVGNKSARTPLQTLWLSFTLCHDIRDMSLSRGGGIRCNICSRTISTVESTIKLLFGDALHTGVVQSLQEGERTLEIGEAVAAPVTRRQSLR